MKPTLQQLRTRRAAILEDAKRNAANTDSFSEQRHEELVEEVRKYDRWISDMEAIQASDAATAEERAALDDIIRPRPQQSSDFFGQETTRCWLPSIAEYRASLAESAALTGGVLVSDQQANFFWDMLRAQSVVLAAGPRIVRMVSDVAVVPKLKTSTSVAFYTENSALSSTELTTESVTLTARKVAAYSLISNELLADSSPDIRAVAAYDFASAMALGIDLAFLDGSGTPPTPRGLRNLTSVTETAAGANGARPTLGMLMAQIGRLEALNADISRCAWFMHPRDWHTLKNAIDDEGQYILNNDPSGPFVRRVAGIPVFLSTQLATNEEEGSSGAVCSSIILADMSQIAVGIRQEVTLQYSEHVAFDSDSTAVRAVARMDLQPVNVAGVDILTGCLASA